MYAAGTPLAGLDDKVWETRPQNFWELLVMDRDKFMMERAIRSANSKPNPNRNRNPVAIDPPWKATRSWASM